MPAGATPPSRSQGARADAVDRSGEVLLPPVAGLAPVVDGLARRGLSVAVAESLTGGLVMATLTQVPGASAVVRGGVVAYADDVKVRVLGVPADLLQRVGPVHADVAAEMAERCRRLLGSSIGLATTGEAGPVPATAAPVGTFFVALAQLDALHVEEGFVDGDREAVRRGALVAALGLLSIRAMG